MLMASVDNTNVAKFIVGQNHKEVNNVVSGFLADMSILGIT